MAVQSIDLLGNQLISRSCIISRWGCLLISASVKECLRNQISMICGLYHLPLTIGKITFLHHIYVYESSMKSIYAMRKPNAMPYRTIPIMLWPTIGNKLADPFCRVFSCDQGINWYLTGYSDSMVILDFRIPNYVGGYLGKSFLCYFQSTSHVLNWVPHVH